MFEDKWDFFFFFWCVLVLENMKCTVNVEIW